MADSAQKMIKDHDKFVDLLLKAKDDQVAKMILIDTTPGAEQVALDEASYTIKQSPGGTTLSGPNSSFFVLRPGRTTDAFVVSCDIDIEERRPSRSVSRAREEAAQRAARERRGDDALNRAAKLAEAERKRQRDDAAQASSPARAQHMQPSAEALLDLLRKATDTSGQFTQAPTPMLEMHRADAPEAIPKVQLTPFKPQIGKSGEPLTEPMASVAHDDATQKFLRQNWDHQRQFSTNGALRDTELAMLSPPLLLRGTPAEAEKRIDGLRDRLKTYCVELKEVMKAKPAKAKGARPPINAAVDPLWLKEHIDVYVTLMERLVGTLFPQDSDGWRPYIWAAVAIIAEVANQALLYAQGHLTVVTEYRAQLSLFRYDPQALVNKVLTKA